MSRRVGLKIQIFAVQRNLTNNATAAKTLSPFFCAKKLQRRNVDRAQLIGVLGIGFCLKRNFLPLFQTLITFRLNGRIMYENVVAALIVCNKAIAFSELNHLTVP